VFLIERVGAVDSWDEIFVFRAADRSAAFQRALEIGRNREESFVNGDGDWVVWRFAEVVTLDELRADDLDGAEVYCTVLGAPSSGVSFNAVFRPDQSEPGMTGV
jgi:hypothetical protein